MDALNTLLLSYCEKLAASKMQSDTIKSRTGMAANQIMILCFLDGHEDPAGARITDIQEDTKLHREVILTNLIGLHSKGLVKHIDSRGRHFAITDSGIAKVADARARASEAVTREE